MSSFASTTSGRSGDYGGSVAASIYDRAMSGMRDLANRYSSNHALANSTVGAMLDTFRTDAQTASQIRYNDAFLGSLSQYQSAMNKEQSGYALQYLAAEGAVDKEKLAAAGDQQRRGTQVAGEEERKGIETRGNQDRLGYQTQGTEQRLTQDNQTDNVIRLRNDAREQIKRQGQRMFVA